MFYAHLEQSIFQMEKKKKTFRTIYLLFFQKEKDGISHKKRFKTLLIQFWTTKKQFLGCSIKKI